MSPSSDLPKRAAWVRVWLAGLAFLYPALWLANFTALALPALLRVAVIHYHLDDFEIIPFGAFASSSPPAVVAGSSSNNQSPFSLAIPAALAIAMVAILAVAGRRHRTLSGITLATLATVLLMRSLSGVLFGRSRGFEAIFGSALFFAILCVGLRWMLDAWVTRGYGPRVLAALVGFVLPLALALLGSRWFSLEFRPIILLLIAPGALAALVASSGPASDRPESSKPPVAGWKTVAAGVAVTAMLAAGIGPAGRAANQAFRRARSTQAQAELADLPAVPANAPYPKIFFQRGVNFTAEWPDRYDSQGARQMLRLLPAYGINAIALVPYGWSSAKPPRVRIGGGPETWESDEGVVELARLAHALGMKVMLKPAVWESYKLDIPSAADRAVWFADYGLFLDHYARLAAAIHADVLVVGGEFNHLTQYDADWRRLIARTRQLYPGPLVYAANFGEEFETIRFWDALDYIGLQEYYSLPDDLSAASVVTKVESVQARFAKPVVFTEAGFPASAAPNRQPWDDHGRGSAAPDAQARCYDSILSVFYAQPWFEGVYWWKVGTDGGGGRQDSSLTPWGKPAMDVVKRWYVSGGR